MGQLDLSKIMVWIVEIFFFSLLILRRVGDTKNQAIGHDKCELCRF